MTDFLISWADATWQMLVDSAPYFLLGLLLAGIIWVFLNEKNLSRLVGNNPGSAVWRAALIGVPLPLCSCSVLPVATQLRQTGLTKGATASFLISTPESSVDSILLTYSLTDPLLTVARPVAAFLTAAVAGFTENAFDSETAETSLEPVTAACEDGCACQTDSARNGSLLQKVAGGLKHAFTTLIGDLSPYLFVGFLLAGLVAALFTDQLSNPSQLFAGSWLPYLGAVLIGLPLYICATSSTPLAAVLLAAGFQPGAVLVFLMVGPATNLATLAVVKRILGLASTVRYLLSILVVSILCGLVVDWLYDLLSVAPRYTGTATHHDAYGLFSIACAVILAALILRYSARWAARKLS